MKEKYQGACATQEDWPQLLTWTADAPAGCTSWRRQWPCSHTGALRQPPHCQLLSCPCPAWIQTSFFSEWHEMREQRLLGPLGLPHGSQTTPGFISPSLRNLQLAKYMLKSYLCLRLAACAHEHSLPKSSRSELGPASNSHSNCRISQESMAEQHML